MITLHLPPASLPAGIKKSLIYFLDRLFFLFIKLPLWLLLYAFLNAFKFHSFKRSFKILEKVKNL